MGLLAYQPVVKSLMAYQPVVKSLMAYQPVVKSPLAFQISARPLSPPQQCEPLRYGARENARYGPALYLMTIVFSTHILRTMAGLYNGMPHYRGDLDEYDPQADSASDPDSEDCEAEPPPRDPGTRGGRSNGSFNKSWTQWTTVDGWVDAQDALRTKMIDQASGGQPLIGGCTLNANDLYYKFRCPFFHSHGCPWMCRFRIEKTGTAQHAVVIKHNNPIVQDDHRAQAHAGHRIILEYDDAQHSTHVGVQKTKGAHQMWKCAAFADNSMYSWNRMQIKEFIARRKMLFDHPFKEALLRIQKHNGVCRKRVAAANHGVDGNVTAWAKLQLVAAGLQLSAVAEKPGFTVHTPYLVPGSHADARDDRGCCLLLTTVNNMLNFARMNQLNPTVGASAGIDHTFKVGPPHCIALPVHATHCQGPF